MLWIVIAIIGYLFLAATFILDKYILSKTKVAQPTVYAFYSTIIMWGALAILPFSSESWSILHIVIGLLSGLAFGFGLYTLYIGVKGGEASHINPISGAVVTLVTYTLSHTFLYEALLPIQLIGMGLLILASIFLSYAETRKQKGFHTGYAWAILSGIFFAASHVSAKYLYDIHEFLPALAWTRAGAGILGIILFFTPSVRREFALRFAKKSKKKKTPKPASLALVWIAKIVGVVAVVLLQYASALGSVTVVQAMSGLQYALMFLAIFIFSKWFPRTFKEYFSRRELALQTTGTLLVLVGSVFIVIPCLCV